MRIMRPLNIIFPFFFFLFLTVQCLAQQPHLRHYTDESGLPSMVIYEMSQDENGFLWIGTDNGFCRYDGREFRTYQHPRAKDNEFIGVYTAPNNVVWCWNVSGQLFKVENDKLKLFEAKGLSKDFLVNKVISNAKGELWLSDANWWKKSYCYCDEKENCAIKSHMKEDKERYDFLKQIHNTNKREPIFLRGANFFEHSETSQVALFFARENTVNKMVYFFSTKDGALHFFSTFSYVGDFKKKENEYSIEQSKMVVEFKKYITHPVKNIYIDHIGNWWAWDNDELFAFTADYKALNRGKPILKGVEINNILQDSEKGYWIGTNGKGLFYMPNYEVINFNENNSILSQNSIIAVLPRHNGEAAIFTKKGDVFVSQQNKIVFQKSLNGTINFVYKKEKTAGYRIEKNNHFETLNEDFSQSSTDGVHLGSIKDFIETEDSLYIGNHEMFSIRHKRELLALSSLKRSVLKKRTYALAKNYAGEIWVGTASGLYVYDGKKIIPFKITKNDNLDLWVNDIVESKDSTLWVATKADGVFGIKNRRIVAQIAQEDGLAGNTCELLYLDNDGDLWVATTSGLSLLNLETGAIKVIDYANGLASNAIKSIYVENNKAWIGTSRGLSMFDKKEMTRYDVSLPITITNIKINGKEAVLKSTYSETFERNSFQFQFLAPSFKRQENVKYQYKMVGTDNTWLETTSNTVLYNNLQPGKYEFKVRAADDNGHTSEVVKTIMITIDKPYWATWWFYLFSTLLVLSILLTVFYIWLNYYKSRKERELSISKKMSELRINALQSQMNPHFIFNALNAIQNFFTTNDKEMAMIYLSKFAKLIRLIFEYSKLSAISLSKEIAFIQLYIQLEELRFSDKIEFYFETVNVVDKEYIIVPPLLIQPIIENALKHGLLHKEKGGKLFIKFQQLQDGSLHCIVEDNGIGRAKAAEYNKWRPKEYKSSGIETIRERVALVNREYEEEVIQFSIIDLVKDGVPAGTRVEFWMKLPE